MRPFYGDRFLRSDSASPASDLAGLLATTDASSVGVFVDENVPREWLPNFELPSGGVLRVIDGGEEHKTLEALTSLVDDHQTMLDKHSVVVVIGGGATLDLVGLFCGLLYRGLRYISVPTTMMSMADAAYGGKTAINYGAKNQIGMYHHPLAVYVNPNFLASLTELHLRSGLVEVAKLAVFYDDIRAALESSGCASAQSCEALGDLAILAAVRKLELLSDDPFEDGPASVMVYGHPFANAFESFARETRGEYLPHGAAVALGIGFSAWLSDSMDAGALPHAEQLALVAACLDPLDFVTDYTPAAAELRPLLERDKYATGGAIRLPALEGPPGYASIALSTVEREYASWRAWMLAAAGEIPNLAARHSRSQPTGPV